MVTVTELKFPFCVVVRYMLTTTKNKQTKNYMLYVNHYEKTTLHVIILC